MNWNAAIGWLLGAVVVWWGMGYARRRGYREGVEEGMSRELWKRFKEEEVLAQKQASAADSQGSDEA